MNKQEAPERIRILLSNRKLTIKHSSPANYVWDNEEYIRLDIAYKQKEELINLLNISKKILGKYTHSGSGIDYEALELIKSIELLKK